MHQQLAAVLELLQKFSYLGVFISLLFVGYVIPFPEEVVLMLIGYVAGRHFVNLELALVVAMAGLLTGDLLLFVLSRGGSKLISQMRRHISKHRLMKYEAMLHDHIGKTVFLSRFVVGLRIFSPILAGTSKIRWQTFLLFDALAIVIYVPIFVGLGFVFQYHLKTLLAEVLIVRHVTMFLALALFGFFVARYLRKEKTPIIHS